MLGKNEHMKSKIFPCVLDILLSIYKYDYLDIMHN